jgi:DNA-binding transcriptional LysR family regulator
MNTEQLRLFLTIVRYRSLARAASELDLGQATVSERLKTLEVEVGTRLFERLGRGVSLTPAGEAFKPYAQRALDVLREAADSALAAGEGRAGQVTVAVTVTAGAFLFAPALVAFRQAHPKIDVRVRSAHSSEAPGLILDGVVELAFVSGPIIHPQIETVATITLPLVLVVGANHPLAGQRISLAELGREQVLVTYWGKASQAFLDRVRDESGSQSSQWMELSPVELIKGMLVAGIGISLVPQIAVQRELKSGELVQLKLADRSTRLPLWEIALIRHKYRQPTLAGFSLSSTVMQTLNGKLVKK